MKSVIGTAAAMALVVAGSGAGLAVAHPGHPGPSPAHGQGTPHRADTPPCVNAPLVAYVFRGRVTNPAASPVTVNLSGVNSHARRALGSASISGSVATDLLQLDVTGRASVTRNGTATPPANLVVGDRVVVTYRGPNFTTARRCSVGAQFTVVGTGVDYTANLSGAAVTMLKRVTATPA